MADNISIVMTLNDQISGKLKTIASAAQGCSKATEELTRKSQQLGDRYKTLTQQSAGASAEALAVKRAMDEAAKSFKKTGDEADLLNFEKLKERYNDLTVSAKGYAAAAQDTVKEIRALDDEVRKMDLSGGIGQTGAEEYAEADGGSGGFMSKMFDGDISGKLAQSGIYKMIGNTAANVIGTMAESALGQPLATIGGSAVSGAAEGAAALAFLGPQAALAGAGVGAVMGLFNGGTQIYQEQDNAFKSYVQDAYEGQISAQEATLSVGSTLAAGRETDQISFTQLFGSEETADNYLSGVVDMSNNTPFLYEDLKSMSKTLATYGFTAESGGEDDYNAILPTLQTIGDAGAALGQSTSDMTSIATALGRMRSSDKTTLEYLNILNDRGIGAVGMLAEAKGVSQGDMYTMISKGQIAGTEAAEIILNAMADSFQGAMEKQSQTYSGLSSTVEGLGQELDNAMGEGYNEERKKGLAAQRDWLSGDSGDAVMEANRAIGAWKAELENSKEQYIRDAMDAMMSSAEYRTAQEQGDAAEMGRLIMEAKVQGMNEYNASEGAQLALASEKALAEAIRDDTATNSDYWDAGYEKGQWFTKGLAAAVDPEEMDTVLMKSLGLSSSATDNASSKSGKSVDPQDPDAVLMRSLGLYAYGLDYVPYDEFPALLHQGERVLTAAEARAMDRGVLPIEQAAAPLGKALWGPRENPTKWFSWGEEEQRSGAQFSPLAAETEWSGFRSDEGDWAVGTFAFGLKYAPYDNFPALLHQGERILSPEEAREANRTLEQSAIPFGAVPWGEDEQKDRAQFSPQAGVSLSAKTEWSGFSSDEDRTLERSAVPIEEAIWGSSKNAVERISWGDASVQSGSPSRVGSTAGGTSSVGGGINVTVTGNEFHVRQDSDIDDIAEAIVRKLQLAWLRGGG